MNRSRSFLVFSNLAVMGVFIGCSASDSRDEDESDVIAESNAAFALAQLVGGYVDTGGAGGTYSGIALRSDKTYVADLATGARITGTWSATPRRLDLTRAAAPPVRLTYSLGGGVLMLWDGVTYLGSLNQQDTYCRLADDCAGQDYVIPRCVGYATCDTHSKSCGFSCGANPCGAVVCPVGEICTVEAVRGAMCVVP